MQQPAHRLIGIVILIALTVSGLIYSRYGYSMLFPAGHEFINHNGDIAGGDFLVFYNAAVMTIEGAAQFVWDHAAFDASLMNIYGQEITRLHFFNPPTALPLWAPLGYLHHVHALWLWTLLPLLALGWFIYKLTGSVIATLLTVIAPLTAYTAGGGQTGILFAALMAGFALGLQRNPAGIGTVAALFTIKPHLAIAMPFCFLIERNWRALAIMASVVAVMSIFVTLAFGFGVWKAFIDGIRFHSGEFFHAANPTFDRSPSMLMLMLRLGAGATDAWIAQIGFSLAALLLLTVIWRGTEDALYRVLSVAIAVCLLTPKILHYDLMVLLVPVAMLSARVVHGEIDWSLLPFVVFIYWLPYFEPAFRVIGFHPGAPILFAALVAIAFKSVSVASPQQSPA